MTMTTMPTSSARRAVRTRPLLPDLLCTDLLAPLLPMVEQSANDVNMLDAIVISDIHLGAENCQAKAAADFLQQILDGDFPTKQLIINGDVFDSIDFRRLRKTHWKVLSQIRHLSDKLDIIWIAGNHDGSAEIVSHLLGVRVVEQHVLVSNGRRVLIVHGHAFDDFIEDHPLLTRLGDFGYHCLQKLDRSHRFARLAKSKSKTFIRCADKIRRRARELAARMHCEAVLCGHTHRAEATDSTSEQPVAYYNSGCWTENPSTYLTIKDGAIALHTYRAKAPEMIELPSMIEPRDFAAELQVV